MVCTSHSRYVFNIVVTIVNIVVTKIVNPYLVSYGVCTSHSRYVFNIVVTIVNIVVTIVNIVVTIVNIVVTIVNIVVTIIVNPYQVSRTWSKLYCSELY